MTARAPTFKPADLWITFNPERPDVSELPPIMRALIEEWCDLYACPVFYERFEIGLCIEHDEAPEIRIDLEKMIGAMEGTEFETAKYEEAAALLERCAALMRAAGEKARRLELHD